MSGTPYRFLLLCAVSLLVVTTGLFSQGTTPVYDPEGEASKLEQINREGRESEANRQSGEDVRGREEWFSFQRRFPYDMIPAGVRTQALRETQAMEQRLRSASRSEKREGASILAANRWESIGPSNIGGRVRAVAVQPGNPDIIYIGAAAGGVWKTTDGGDNWKTTTDTLGSLAIGAIAIDYSKSSTIYIGTGENTVNIDSYLGAGIYKSTDGGNTWKQSGLESVGAVSKLFVHRQNSKIIYAACAKRNGGFYRSEDAGVTWKKVVTGDVFDLAVNPTNSNEVYISFSNQIRRSTDGGNSFSTVNTGLTLSGGLRISIAIAPSQPSRLYALIARDGGGSSHIGEAYITTNSGANWTLKKTFDQFFFNRQGWYDNCMAVDPVDPNVVLAGGIDVYRSTDGGDNWTNTTRSYFGGDVHPDQHVLEFDQQSSGIVFLGNDGGVYASVDAATTWKRVSLTLPITQYYAMEIDQTKLYRAYGGSQDNGTHGSYGTASFTQDWKRILGGDGFYVAVDLTDPNIIYAEQFNGTPLYRIDANNTNSRTRIDASISTDADNGDFGYWSTPIAMSPADKKTLYTGRTKLYRTTNRGTSWQTLSPTTGAKISTIGLSLFDAKKIMVGTQTGEVAYTTNDGQSWAKTAGGPARFVSDIVYDPTNPDRVYVGFAGLNTGHIYRSDDNGATLTNISANLPNTPVNAIAIDPRDNNHIFLGTDVGVFVSLDGGGYWMPFNDGLALAPIADMKIHSTSHTLFAATHGRSMFKVNITAIEAQPVLINPVGGITVNTPGQLPVRWVGLNGPVRILISYDGGRTYQVVADNVPGTVDTLDIPNARSNSVRIKVVEINGGRSVESEDFTVKATTNGTELGRKGFVAEAIEYRRGYMWATVRGTDSLFKMKLTLLSPKTALVRTGIPGRVIDMAYNDAIDRFYMLTAENDFGNPKLYRMDSNGAAQGQVPLPEEVLRASGVAMTDEGIAVITPGRAGEIFIINDAGTLIRRTGALLGADDEFRRGLVWDRLGFVQGVVGADTSVAFPSELQFMADENPLRVRESTPVVLTNIDKLVFFGLAFDPSNADVNKRIYFATDTSGAFYRFDREKFFTSSVEITPGAIEYVSREVALGTITPNPMRGASDIHFTVRSRRAVTVELYDAAGTRVASIFEGSVEPGEHIAHLDGAGLASGIYYVTLSGGAGERDVKPVVVVK